MAPKYKLTYFDIWGRAEPLRMTFVAAGVPFEDKRITGEEWKNFKSKTPRGYMPVLEIEGMPGKMFSESVPLFHFLAREFGLDGKSNVEKLLAETAVEDTRAVTEAFAKQHYAKDDAKAGAKAAFEETLVKACKHWEAMLRENAAGDGFLVGKSLTWADIGVHHTLTISLKLVPELLQQFPKLAANRQKVESLPRLAAYLKSRRDSVA